MIHKKLHRIVTNHLIDPILRIETHLTANPMVCIETPQCIAAIQGTVRLVATLMILNRNQSCLSMKDHRQLFARVVKPHSVLELLSLSSPPSWISLRGSSRSSGPRTLPTS